MKKFKQLLMMAGVSAALSMGAANVQAQGNFDPEQMRQRMMENVRERLEIKDDAEWKIVSERVEKVMTARREIGGGGMGLFGRPGGGRRGGNGDGGGGGNADGGQRRRFGGEPSQAAKDLEAAIEAKAPADEIKAKLDKYRAFRKEKEADLAKAQDKLKEVLNARQEAAAVLAGLLQ